MVRSRLSNLEVAHLLEDFLEGKGHALAWDGFLIAEVADKRLEQIQRHCNLLSEEFPPEKPGEYCNEQGREVIRRNVDELRHR